MRVSKAKAMPAHELRELAKDVRKIGAAHRSDPETICIQKDEIAHRLLELAKRLEHAA
jgi:hypothetical protein